MKKMIEGEKIKQLNVQHHKEATVYDKARAWSDLEPITAKSVRDIKLSKDKTVMLDVAAGTGRVSEYFKHKVKTVVGLDISPDMIQVAQTENRIDVGVIAPGEETPFLDNSFDLIYCRSAMHYMDQKKAVKEWVRVTRDGGHVIVADASFDNEVVNKWYEKMLQCILPQMKLVYHKKVMGMFNALGQKNTSHETFMVHGSLNDVLTRKHTPPKRVKAVKKMYEDAPAVVKDIMSIHKVGDDFEFKFGWTITRCKIEKPKA